MRSRQPSFHGVNFFGTIFRGLSPGSVLLVVALGLAITFGLMGVINMAHGEMIAVGAYTTYVVQNHLRHRDLRSSSPFRHFRFTLRPVLQRSRGWTLRELFLVRAAAQLLHRRPGRASPWSGPSFVFFTGGRWKVSARHLGRLARLAAVFRLVFGSNNVQVGSPSYLSGNWTFNDIISAGTASS